MDKTTNSLNWFEIPATDLDRSKKFYETLFEIDMPIMEMDATKMAMFPMEPGSGKANGAIAQGPIYTPSKEGAKVYLNANPNMDAVLARVEAAGGTIEMPKTPIGPNGFIAFIIDTEGNQVGIHSTE